MQQSQELVLHLEVLQMQATTSDKTSIEAKAWTHLRAIVLSACMHTYGHNAPLLFISTIHYLSHTNVQMSGTCKQCYMYLLMNGSLSPHCLIGCKLGLQWQANTLNSRTC